jgi:hypothetical protein
VIQAAAPVILPAGGTFTAAQNATITDATPGAVIHYTVDGSTPTASSPVYTASLAVIENATVQAIAIATGYGTSPIASALYLIEYPTATPVISPAGGTYATTQTVTITDSTPGAKIYYTTDGTTPTTSSGVYGGSIAVLQSETVQAIALASGDSLSTVSSQTYTLNLPTAPAPIFSLAGGIYSSTQTVTVSDSVAGAAIHYTIDGSTATVSSPIYMGPLLISSSTKISALATAPSYNPSSVATATYFISSTTAPLTGKVLSGTVPIYNATMNLYSAGTSGYGAGATLLATTTSDISGNFTFTKLSNGAGLAGDGTNWSCPASDPNPDPQIYITAVGGDTQGTGTTTTNNGAAAFLAAIGPCSTVSSSTQIQMNELTTVATVFALAQYINPGTSPGTIAIGTNGANTSSSTPQGAVGLNNAVASIANLANLSAGSAVTQNSYKGTNSTTTTTTVTATPEKAKLTTIADVIAACINTTTSSSNQCGDLFVSASPPPVVSVTSQPAATFATAQDTIQAAYYMAVNPINAGSFTTCSTSSASTKTGCLFNLAAASPIYTTGLTSAPLDWTIGVSYTPTSTCVSGRGFIANPFRSAVDAYGNIWFIGGYMGSVSVSAMSPIGVPLFCASTTAGGSPYFNGITIDTMGNIWASVYTTGTSGEIYEVPNPGAVPVVAALSTFTSAQLASGAEGPLNIVGDAYGNVFYAAATSAGTSVYEIPAGTTNASTPASYLIGASFPATTTVNNSNIVARAADSVGRVYFPTSASVGETLEVTPPSAGISSFSISGGSITFIASNTPSFTVGQQVIISGLTSTEGLLLNRQELTLTAVVGSTFTATTSVAATSGSITDAGVAVVVPTGASSYSTIVNDFQTTLFGGAVDNNSYLYSGTTNSSASAPDEELLKATISPTGVALTDQTATGNYTFSPQFVGGLNGVRSVALDGADNVWFGNAYPSVDAATGESKIAGTWNVGEVYTTGKGSTAKFFALSPAQTGLQGSDTCGGSAGCTEGGGFQKSSLGYTSDINVDPSGNVWALNTGITSTAAVGGGTNITEIVGAAVPTVTPLSVAAANGTLATKP